MCAEGMDGPVSTMKQSSHRGISQSSYSSGMGAVDEEISAMLQSNHHANMTGMMAPAADHLAAYQQAYAMYSPGSYAGSMQQRQPALRPRGSNLEEKYVNLEAKSEVAYAFESTAGLHRYHSAPASAFLAELNEPGPPPPPPQQQQQLLGLYGDGGLTSISENMENNSAAEYEHYMAPENDFARCLANFPVCKEEAATPTTLLQRQSSVLVQLNTEHNTSDKSSSRNSDDNKHLINGYTASMYSQEDFLWKSPTSPAKRQRGLEPGESETSSGSVDGSAYRNGGLVRHMSLPSPTSCSPGVEGNSSFTVVPMRTRAKRGCATHPRSIAERVRRTKISERMKRLQDLVPDMDKQTNTSDMLDETVEYVKLLQHKVQELTETVAQLQAAAAKHNNTNLELGVAMDA